MRKLAAAAAVLILLSALSLTAFAAEGNLTMTDVQANAGDTIQITVSLTEPVQGNALGITYTYDESRLEALPEQCAWVKKGTLQDFGSRNRDGVWAVSDPVQLQGEVCILVFRILEEQPFEKTEVSCSLTVKNGAAEVGTWQAAATVAKQCDHSFGPWSDSGELGHSRTCSACAVRQTQAHAWDDGTVSGTVKTTTCTVCSATRTETVSDRQPDAEPTQPETTRPQEETRPAEERPKPTYPEETKDSVKPTTPEPTESPKTETTRPTEDNDLHGSGNQEGYQPGDYNCPPEDTRQEESGIPAAMNPSAAGENRESAPMVIPIEGWTGDPETEAESQQSHDHDHIHTEAGKPSGLSAFTALATVVAMAALAWWYMKKKR